MSTANPDKAPFNRDIAAEILKYAAWLAGRGYIANTLGNIAVRAPHADGSASEVIYTKHMGVSLEEATIENIVVTDIEKGNLVYGKTPPSVGHVMNRTIYKHRPDANAVIHCHVNEVIAYFSTTQERTFRYISADAALVMGKPVLVLSPNINVEQDAEILETVIGTTNCIIMPNHGVTTLGRNLSEAYHRMNTMTAELKRITLALQVAAATNKDVQWISEGETQQMYDMADELIYGHQSPAVDV